MDKALYRLQWRGIVMGHVWDALWLIALVIYVLAGTPLVPFHGDESTQIYMSRDYAYQFIQHDLNKIAYSKTPVSETEQQLRLVNGTLAKYSIGLAWHMAGFTLEDLNEQWDWGADWDYNQQNGHAPTPELLLAARWPLALLTAGSVILMFAVGWMLHQRPGAYLASLIYALNPAVLLNGRRAMMEGDLLFFMLLALLTGLWLMQRFSWRRAMLFGAASGLAFASKHTALFGVVGAFAALAAYPVAEYVAQRVRPKDAAAEQSRSGIPVHLLRDYAQLALAGVLMLATFLLVNPAWWGANPLEVGTYVIDLRENLLETQVSFLGGYANTVDKLAGFLRQTVIVAPQYYEVDTWADYVGGEVAPYEASPWRGVSVALLGSFSTLAGVIWGAIIALGGWRLLRERQIDVRLRWLIGIWAGTITIMILLLTPLEWQRYYLPIYPVVSILAMMGLVWLARQIRSLRPV